MRIHSFIKVCIAVITIAFAMTMSTVHGSTRMQAPTVLWSNVIQVVMTTCNSTNIKERWCGIYDRIAPDRWVLRLEDGKVSEFVEGPHSPINQTVMTLKSASGMDVQFELVWKKVLVGMGTDSRGRSRGGSGSGTIIGITEISSDNLPETCKQQTLPGVKCNCDLGSLRPLQGAVGLAEVMKKKDDIVNGETKKRLDLAYDPIKIVRGPLGLLYVTDHHHGARAWLEAGHTMGTCEIQDVRITDIYTRTVSTDSTGFWIDLNTKKLVRLDDENGNSITEKQLPTTLRDLPDDPYRTLAWMVRKKDGFCRALMQGDTEFAEFKWADWFRTRPELPYDKVKASPRNMRDAALRLAKSTAAVGLPGYRGDQPANYTCPADPD